jgi:hypothetical protein
MLKRLSRKLITLSVLVVALVTVSFAPVSSANNRGYCYEVPICSDGCCSGYVCCDRWGNCSCG